MSDESISTSISTLCEGLVKSRGLFLMTSTVEIQRWPANDPTYVVMYSKRSLVDMLR